MAGKVLIVDDEFSGRQTLESVLETDDYELEMAENGKDAIEKAKAFLPDVILLDLMMPVMSGHEAFGHFRKIRKDIPVVIISGYSTDRSLQEVLESDRVQFLRKPFEMVELNDALKMILQNG